MYGKCINALILEGAIAEIWDPRSGHWNGLVNGLDGVPSAGMVQLGPGGPWIPSATTDEVTVADNPLLRLIAGSIVAVSEHGFTSQTTNEVIAGKRDGASRNYILYLGAAGLYMYDGASVRSLATNIIGKKSIGCTFTHGSTPIGYSDGTSLGNFSGTINVVATAGTAEIGNSANTSPLKSPASAVLIANRVLTETEMNLVQAELLAARWPSTQVGFAKRVQHANSAESGLVAAWDMDPVDGEVIDVMGASNGTIVGAPTHERGILGPRMRFDGVDDYVNCGNIGTIKTFAFDVNPATTTEDFVDLDGGTHTVEVAAGTITATGWDAPTIYVDGVATASLIANKTQRVVVTTPTGIAASAVMLAMETIFLEGTICNPRFYSDEKSAAWVAQDHLFAARAVQFQTDWGFPISTENEGGVLGQQIGGHASPFRAGDTTGRYKVETDVVNGRLCKVLTCITAGDLELSADCFFDTTPTEAAFGTAGLLMYKPDAAAIVWKFAGTDTDPTANGYAMTWGADESVVISELGVGNVVAGGTASADAWHEFDKTRTGAGLFEGFVDRASFGTGTDATVITSVGMVWRMEAGCKICLGNVQGDQCLYKQLGVTL